MNLSFIFRGSANLGFGEFGSVGGNVDLQVPETGGFLTTLIYGLAALTLVNTVVAVATALWPQEAETTEKIDKNEQARRMRKVMDIGQTVFAGIQQFAERYNH